MPTEIAPGDASRIQSSQETGGGDMSTDPVAARAQPAAALNTNSGAGATIAEKSGAGQVGGCCGHGHGHGAGGDVDAGDKDAKDK